MTNQWFRALVPGGHVGAGRVEERVIYLYASDICQAERILRTRTGGWKKSKGPFELRAFKMDEISMVEAVINKRDNITMAAAKRSGFLYANGVHRY